jgi:putative acetyltransferase
MTLAISVSLGTLDDPQVLQMLGDSDAYYAGLYPAESNHLLEVSSLRAENVSFFVARDQGKACGFGALVATPMYGEVKRMYVDPASRGLGIGQVLLDRIEQQAGTLGLGMLRLETGVRQPEAIALYRKNGFGEIGPFGDYQPDPLSLFLEKRLTRSAAIRSERDGHGSPDNRWSGAEGK